MSNEAGVLSDNRSGNRPKIRPRCDIIPRINNGGSVSSLSCKRCFLSLICFAAAFAQTQHPPSAVSISVCSPTGAGGPGSCPSGSADTHQIVLAPEGSGSSIDDYAGGGISDEHSSVFSPGMLGNNKDYLF